MTSRSDYDYENLWLTKRDAHVMPVLAEILAAATINYGCTMCNQHLSSLLQCRYMRRRNYCDFAGFQYQPNHQNVVVINYYLKLSIDNYVNSLGTALFCCKFNLVDTDQFSYEYLVWVLCYCSQTDVLFPHWVGALAHTETLRMPRLLRE